MANFFSSVISGYNYVFDELADPRVIDFPLMQTPLHVAVIGILYLYLIFKAIPKFMEDRPPFNLKTIIIYFNICQVLVNAWIFYQGFLVILNFNWFCAPIDWADTPTNRFNLKVAYVYFLTKLADLLDTIFFVLRKKDNQVTFLHVYHHFGMILLGYCGVKFFAGGQSFYLGVINSFVHTVMYSYYLITVWKPELKKSLWWKKYITQLQLYQFVFLFFTFGQLLFKPWCTYPKIACYFIMPQNIFMIYLFSDFYYKTYIKTDSKTVKKT